MKTTNFTAIDTAIDSTIDTTNDINKEENYMSINTNNTAINTINNTIDAVSSTKKVWALFHVYDDEIAEYSHRVKKFVGLMKATDEEIDKYVKTWDHPQAYGHDMYEEIFCHHVVAEEVSVMEYTTNFIPFRGHEEKYFLSGIMDRQFKELGKEPVDKETEENRFYDRMDQLYEKFGL